MKHLALCLALGLAISTPPVFAGSTEAPSNTMWNLKDLFPSNDAWNAEFTRIQTRVNKLDQYKGTLGKSASAMLAAMKDVSDTRKEIDRLSVYASLKKDEDVRVAENQERAQKAQSLYAAYSEKIAWLTPEILSVGADKVHAFEAEKPELKNVYGFTLQNVLRSGPHTLGSEAESVIAASSNLLAQPDNIFSQLADGELPSPSLTLSDGTKIDRLDQAAYEKYRQISNRADRKKVFDTFWAEWKKYEGTFGAILNTQVLGEEFDAKVRKFPDALSAALFPDALPEAVYNRLVTETHEGLPTFYRYLKLRKRLMGIKGELAYYDMYPSMFPGLSSPHFTIPEMQATALKVTSIYGPHYTELLKHGFDSEWLNAEPHPGKAGGAYMNGSAYDVHPYVLMSEHGDYESMSTMIHEFGHAMHTELTHENQPYEKSNYSTFIAETAAITNEMLLNDYMVKHAKTKEEKLFYLGQGLETIRTTFFRQAMFGEYQLAIHKEVENGGALSGRKLSDIYCGLLKKYYGEKEGITKIDPNYCIEWAFIPHFYYGFYVYQYATSITGAAAFAEKLEKDPAERTRYLDMLKAGGSAHPYGLYKKAGLDMEKADAYQPLFRRMNRLMDEIDQLTKND